MMPVKYVIDANVGFKCQVPEENSDKAQRLFDDFRRGIHELLAPDFFPIEVGNCLVMAARTGRIPTSDLPVVYAELIANLPIIDPSISLFPRAFDIASRTRAPVY